MFLIARRVVQRVTWVLDNGCIARGIGVCAQTEDYFAVLCTSQSSSTATIYLPEHHLAHAPQAVHDFEGLIWILFSDTDDNHRRYPPDGGLLYRDACVRIFLQYSK